MAIFSKTEFNSLDDLFMEQLQDLYDAETRLTGALGKMADAAASTDLADAFRSHLRETETHRGRLERIFEALGTRPERETCEAMKGLIKEAEEMVGAQGEAAVRDAALIAAAQRVEHYEISGYGTACTFARQLGHEDAANLLQQTLDEEASADERLTEIAESSVNLQAPKA